MINKYVFNKTFFHCNSPISSPCPLSRVRKWSSPCSTSQSDGKSSLKSEDKSSLKSDAKGSLKSDAKSSLKSQTSFKRDHDKPKERKISSPAALHVTTVTTATKESSPSVRTSSLIRF